MRMILFAALALAAGLPATPVGAQSPADGRARISGVVETLAGNTLVIRSADSRDVTIALPTDTRITALANRQLSDIRPGDFVGSAAIRGRDGKLHAQEVHIFPEALRGTGEGHRAMDKPDQSMTNATVAIVSEVAASHGRVLVLNYQGGTQEIEVGPGGSRRDLRRRRPKPAEAGRQRGGLSHEGGGRHAYRAQRAGREGRRSAANVLRSRLRMRCAESEALLGAARRGFREPERSGPLGP